MNKTEICQSDLSFDLYEDLDVIIDGKVGVSFDGTPDTLILTVNGKEVEITGDAAEEIFKALDVRISNKVDQINRDQDEEAAIIQYESSRKDEYEMRIMEKGA